MLRHLICVRGRAKTKWHGPPNPRVPSRRSALSGPQTSRATFTLHCGTSLDCTYVEVIEIKTAQNPGSSGFSLVLYNSAF